MSPDAAPTTNHCGRTLDGKYALERFVARGGYGAVYKGTHLALDCPVAVKVLKAPEHLRGPVRVAFLEAFAREARTIAKLEHPAVVRVIDFGASPMAHGAAAPWMVLEWLAGETLEGHLAQRRGAGGRTPVECLALLRVVFEALAAAHDAGVAHRDIKPANIMVASRTSSGRSTSPRRGEPLVRVMDFGIAKVMQPDEVAASGATRTQAALVAFSLPYAAPEQVSGTRTGPWTDVHALALLLTEMLTDRAPYVGDEAMGLHLEVLSSTRPTPAKFGVDVGAWEPVIAHAAAIRPAERFASAGEFLAALEATLDGATHRPFAAGAPWPDSAQRTGTTLRPVERPPAAPRHRATLVAALAVSAALVGVGVQGLGLLRLAQDFPASAPPAGEPPAPRPPAVPATPPAVAPPPARA